MKCSKADLILAIWLINMDFVYSSETYFSVQGNTFHCKDKWLQSVISIKPDFSSLNFFWKIMKTCCVSSAKLSRQCPNWSNYQLLDFQELEVNLNFIFLKIHNFGSIRNYFSFKTSEVIRAGFIKWIKVSFWTLIIQIIVVMHMKLLCSLWFLSRWAFLLG